MSGQAHPIRVGPPSLYARLLRPVARFTFKHLLGGDHLSPQDLRRRVDFIGALSKKLAGIERIPVQAGTVNAQWLNAVGSSESSPVILYLHGGGYVSGSIKSHWELAARLARAAQARCLIIDYRLAPEHPFPAALEDSVASWQWLLDQGISATQMVMAGDSAGAGLALATSLKLRELGLPTPAGIYAMSPWADVSLSGNTVQSKKRQEVVLSNPNTLSTAAASYAADHDRREPLISPVFANLHGLPTLLVHIGSEEVLLDDSIRLRERAIAAGVNCQLKLWEGLWHVWPLFASVGLREARVALDEAAEFINESVSQSSRDVDVQPAA